MAKRENCIDLDELIRSGLDIEPMTLKGMESTGGAPGFWYCVAREVGPNCAAQAEYKNDRSAASTASLVRKKLGRDRVRVAARGRFVYVYFKPVEVAEAA